MRVLIGYGNPLRRDDALGPHVAALVAERHPEVEVCVAHQLTPELSELVARAELAVFVDARHDRREQGVLCEALEPTRTGHFTAHHSEPGGLLWLAQALYGRHAPAWLVTLPAHDLGLGEGLSPHAELAVPAAVARISELFSETSA